MKLHNKRKTCWNCPAALFRRDVGFGALGQSTSKIRNTKETEVLIECARRPELGRFEPSVTFEECSEWIPFEYGLMLRNMRVLVLGMDGYLGWPLALKLARLGFEVSGIDNFMRRNCVIEKKSHSVVPIEKMRDRLHAARGVLNISMNFRMIDIRNRRKLLEFIKEVRPESIVHYAEVPSAPYSMVDCNHAISVQENNVLGTLGILFAIKEIVPETCLIKLGTLGEYGSPLTGRPLFEGVFPSNATIEWNGRKWSLGKESIPRDPGSFYHVSKVQDTFNVAGACKYWGLRSYDVMQGVVYGVHTNEVTQDPRLRTRFDVDEWFGTVVNRFAAQAVIGMPLTIYGGGKQIKGLIALEDAMECMTRLIVSPPKPGQYSVVNQVSELYKLSLLAETVARVSRRFGLNPKIQRLENPRVEADDHPLEVISRKLPNVFGFEQKVTLEEEIARMIELLMRPKVNRSIKEMAHMIMPRTRWDGLKRKLDVLEVYESGLKEDTGYQPVLDKGPESERIQLRIVK
jgi:UDP-sulfoquinovose synthase